MNCREHPLAVAGRVLEPEVLLELPSVVRSVRTRPEGPVRVVHGSPHPSMDGLHELPAASPDGRPSAGRCIYGSHGVSRPVALWEVTFRNQYPYPFLDLSKRLPGTALSMWCIWNRELLQVPTRDPEVLREVERAIRDAGHVVDEWVDARGGRLFLLECTCGRHESMWNVFDEHECLDSPPAVFLDGWGFHRFLSFDPGRTRALFKDLRRMGPTVLLQKRELPLHVLPSSIWAGSLFGDLTGRQVDAILRAHRSGYYSTPRSVTTDDIAHGLGLSRSTFEEHLRKAENRLINALVPYLELYSTADRPPEKMASRGLPNETERGPAKAVGRA
jgi:predicted DNA binding protein